MTVVVLTCRAQPQRPSRAGPRQHGTGGGREWAGAQRQLEDEYNRRVAVVVDDCAEWVHAGAMRKATLRAFVELGSPFNGGLL